MGTSDRQPYLTATVLDQDFLDNSHDSLTNQLEMVCDIQDPTGSFIRASDRNKYVGGTFYEALLKFPVIRRTIGEWLSNQLEFSVLQLEMNNVDGRFNNLLPRGADFKEWIGRTVEVRLGLRDVSSTYTTIFSGFVSEIGGFSRTVKSVKLRSRDRFDTLGVSIPPAVFTQTTFPNIDENNAGLGVPIIYGDWTTQINPRGASVFAFATNSGDPDVNGENANTTNLDLRISDNDNASFDSSKVYVKRGDNWYNIDSADITSISLGNNAFSIIQDSGNTVIDGDNYIFEQGDEYFVQVTGKDLGAYSDNIVWIARDILLTYTDLTAADFDASWETYRDKSTPAVSSTSTIKGRVWLQDGQSAIDYALSLLEQVRLEFFVDRNLKLKINALHFEDFVASPAFSVRNWDVVRDSFQPAIDVRNNFNRAQGVYNFLPDIGENAYQTSIYRNQAAIDNTGKEISKKVVFPNLYIQADVDNQTQEILKLASSFFEIIDYQGTWRSLLLDIGDFVSLNVQIQSTIFENVPCLIREIGYDPNGLKIPMKIWSFQMTPFPGYEPGFDGTVGGYNATITAET